MIETQTFIWVDTSDDPDAAWDGEAETHRWRRLLHTVSDAVRTGGLSLRVAEPSDDPHDLKVKDDCRRALYEEGWKLAARTSDPQPYAPGTFLIKMILEKEFMEDARAAYRERARAA